MEGIFKNKKTWLIIIILLAIINILLIIFWQPINQMFKKSWYAVHLNNGQVYFGHIIKIDQSNMTLKDVYYLEPYQSENNDGSAPKMMYKLVKRGEEQISKTNNILYINRSVILFWEKLTPQSEIMGQINKKQ